MIDSDLLPILSVLNMKSVNSKIQLVLVLRKFS